MVDARLQPMSSAQDELARLSPEELRGRLAELLDRLVRMPGDDPARGMVAAQRLDVAAALRRATGDDDGLLEAWAERSRRPVDEGKPYIASHGEGGEPG